MAEEFKIRKAVMADMKVIFDLSNDDVVRRNSINQEKIKWDEHQNWFRDKIENSDCEFYVVEDVENKFISQIRIEQSTISISISPSFRGKGLGCKILSQISQKSSQKPILAYVKKTNAASIKTFQKAGYRQSGKKNINGEEFLELIYE